LRTKKVDFEITYINLREKPDWFLKISPHGKVPVLSVGDDVLFESNAIAEFLDETVSPQLHPTDAIKRARNRAWTDFVPDFSKGLSAAYRRDTVEEMEAGRADAEKVLAKLEDAIKNERGNDGPYFNGDTLCLVDAAYAPFLQRFMIAEAKLNTGLLDVFPLVRAWTEALLATDLVTGSVAETFVPEFKASMTRYGYHIGTLFAEEAAAAE
ncbi:MAG: glutathione S-transferase family protein, partial [Pseudomonadota bacterium]|nr:glutathione S-transferase family protein [Pseudomonadota bacterium]